MKAASRLEIVEAHTGERLPAFRQLLLEYAESLGFDLCFQNFDGELANLPGDYAPPTGVALIALNNDEIAGCCALKSLGDGVCEMKRLFVRPDFRSLGIGRFLANEILRKAQALGYKVMKLDTLETMTAARLLYSSLGFEETKPYTHNPFPEAHFMEKKL